MSGTRSRQHRVAFETRTADASLPLRRGVAEHPVRGMAEGRASMAKVTNDLLFEQLKALRGENAEARVVLLELRDRVSSLERGQAELSGTVASMSVRLDRMDDRLYRVERRLELSD